MKYFRSVNTGDSSRHKIYGLEWAVRKITFKCWNVKSWFKWCPDSAEPYSKMSQVMSLFIPVSHTSVLLHGFPSVFCSTLPSKVTSLIDWWIVAASHSSLLKALPITLITTSDNFLMLFYSPLLKGQLCASGGFLIVDESPRFRAFSNATGESNFDK